MVKRIAPIRVISFFLLAAGGAWCQSEHPSAVFLARSLPDSPSAVQAAKPAEKFQRFVDEARSPLSMGAGVINLSAGRGTELTYIAPGAQRSFSTLHKAGFTQEKSSNYLYPSSRQRNLVYDPSTSSSFMGRASYAASRIFIARDDSGRKRLNTSYFLGVLSSVAVHNAYRPYWARSASAPFNDFGSTIGNDAGANLFREFGPGIRQLVNGHAPKFVFRMEERITRDQSLRPVVSTPAR